MLPVAGSSPRGGSEIGEEEVTGGERKRERGGEVKKFEVLRGKRERREKISVEKKSVFSHAKIYFCMWPLKRIVWENKLIFFIRLSKWPACENKFLHASLNEPYAKMKIDFYRHDQLHSNCNI